MIDFLNLPEFVPHPRAIPKVEIPIDGLHHVIETIADVIWSWSLPQHGFNEGNRRHALVWADAIRTQVPMCCATHTIESVKGLLLDIERVLRHCTNTSCQETGNHDFLERAGKCIDEHMHDFLNSVAINHGMRLRVN